jgi:hypothetical protein
MQLSNPPVFFCERCGKKFGLKEFNGKKCCSVVFIESETDELSHLSRFDVGIITYLNDRICGDIEIKEYRHSDGTVEREVIWDDYKPKTDVSEMETDIRRYLGNLFVCFHYAGKCKYLKYRSTGGGQNKVVDVNDRNDTVEVVSGCDVGEMNKMMFSIENKVGCRDDSVE